jgi:tRNA A37 threonylcarbamoyltransferase TsaD
MWKYLLNNIDVSQIVHMIDKVAKFLGIGWKFRYKCLKVIKKTNERDIKFLNYTDLQWFSLLKFHFILELIHLKAVSKLTIEQSNVCTSKCNAIQNLAWGVISFTWLLIFRNLGKNCLSVL